MKIVGQNNRENLLAAITAAKALDTSDKAIQLCVSAGTLIIFSSLTPHSSGANVTKKNRKAYLSQYSSENIIDPFNGIQRGRAYLM